MENCAAASYSGTVQSIFRCCPSLSRVTDTDVCFIIALSLQAADVRRSGDAKHLSAQQQTSGSPWSTISISACTPGSRLHILNPCSMSQRNQQRTFVCGNERYRTEYSHHCQCQRRTMSHNTRRKLITSRKDTAFKSCRKCQNTGGDITMIDQTVLQCTHQQIQFSNPRQCRPPVGDFCMSSQCVPGNISPPSVPSV